jgi:hypothetical protein
VIFFRRRIDRYSVEENEGDVMRSVYTLAFVVFVSFAGLTAHAQPGSESMIQSFATDGALSGISIEGPLVVDFEIPEVNQAIVEIIDTRTGRYLPRLAINLAEFPLRSLTEVSRPNNGRSVQTGTQAEIVVQRIQSRLRVPKFQFAIEDRTAIISGMVATERERILIESMLRFEPGINSVQNEITVVVP